MATRYPWDSTGQRSTAFSTEQIAAPKGVDNVLAQFYCVLILPCARDSRTLTAG